MSVSDDSSLAEEPEEAEIPALDFDDSLTSLALGAAEAASRSLLSESESQLLARRQQLLRLLQLIPLPLPDSVDWESQAERLRARCEVDEAAARLAMEESLAPVLAFADPPVPGPERWQRLEERISSRVSEARGGSRAPSRLMNFSRLAAAIVLMASGAFLARGLTPRTADSNQVEGWLSEARGAMDLGKFPEAEALLERILARAGANPDCHSRLADALNELEALKLFTGPTPKAERQGALRRLIYRHPAARVSALALVELRELAKAPPPEPENGSISLPIEAFKPGFESPRQVLAYEARRKVFLTILKEANDQGMADAARIQLARLDYEHGEHHEARRWLDGIEGQSWAALQARELAEDWSKRQDSRLR